MLSTIYPKYHGPSHCRAAAPVKVIAVLVVVTVLAAVAVAVNLGGGPSAVDPNASKWFYEASTGTLVAGADLGPDQGALPQAYVFACGSCDGERFIGYVEQQSADAASAAKQLAAGDDMPMQEMERLEALVAEGSQVAAIAEGDTAIEWVGRQTKEGRAIVQSPREKCSGASITPCTPAMAGL